jgi:hypothetical protein
LTYFIVKVATGIVNTYGPPGRPVFFKGHLVLKTLSARGLLKWVLVAFFACAGLLNIFATAPLLAEYRQWGYPWWFHYATGLLELSSAFLQARRMTNKAGIALGATVMAAAVITLAMQQAWLHAAFPLLIFLSLIASRITHQP